MEKRDGIRHKMVVKCVTKTMVKKGKHECMHTHRTQTQKVKTELGSAIHLIIEADGYSACKVGTSCSGPTLYVFTLDTELCVCVQNR